MLPSKYNWHCRWVSTRIIGKPEGYEIPSRAIDKMCGVLKQLGDGASKHNLWVRSTYPLTYGLEAI